MSKTHHDPSGRRESLAERLAAKAATDEHADKVAEDVRSGRATVVTDPEEIRRRLGPSGTAPSGAGRKPLAVHDPAEVVTDLAVTLAVGGECLADIALLRGEPGVYGGVRGGGLGRDGLAHYHRPDHDVDAGFPLNRSRRTRQPAAARRRATPPAPCPV